MKVSLVEQIVNTPPRNMQGWRMYRIEYGGHAEQCNVEGTVWLPSGAGQADLDYLEFLFNVVWQGAHTEV